MRRSAIAALVPLLLASCVAPPRPAPAPRPAPVTVAPPPPAPAVATPAPAPTPGPVEPGNWRYTRSGDGSIARFEPQPGSVALSFECRPAERAIVVQALRLNPSAPPAAMTLRASTTVRSIAAGGGGAFGTARLQATDPLLDAIAFSRGRFAVGIDGRERWFPPWPEIARVLEDCRG